MKAPTASRFPEVADRHLIFSINSGRAGSKYLAQLLGTAQDVQSFHEAEPKMSGDFIRLINAEPLAASREKRCVKSEAIAKLLRNSPASVTYAETNHTFIKTFFDVVLEDFRNVEVIILRRNLLQTLRSFVELGYFSELNPLAYSWMSSPNAASAALPAIGPDGELDQFDLCIAYLLDIEARAERFRLEYPHVPVHEVQLEQLNKITFVEDLLARLHLLPTARTKNMCGQKINERRQRKEQIGNPVTTRECEQRLAKYLRRAREKGLKIPALLGR